MSDYVDTITSHAGTSELDHPAIDLDRPDLNDPMEYQDSGSSFSDCESIVSVDQSGLRLVPFISSGLVELSEGDMVRRFLKERFLWRVGALREQVTVVTIHQNGFSSVSARGRARTFQDCSEAVKKKGNGNTANVRYAWYAASREEVSEIFSHGFGHSGKPQNSGLYGRGLYFAPENHLLESVKVAPMDSEGLRHVLLCRVILGKPELVSFGLEQSHPSSEQYDSGIDDLSSPTRYIVWSTLMNTHVLPEYVISFRAPCGLRAKRSVKWLVMGPWRALNKIGCGVQIRLVFILMSSQHTVERANGTQDVDEEKDDPNRTLT
ncbi:hypothetical protein NL676_028796 [Syzygium grande]|nr:hypothetical protein NL676_028796 [Syzygium grande]